MDEFIKTSLMLFVLINPFILSVYLIELIKGVGFKELSGQLIRAGLISYAVFLLFAWAGEALFENVFQIRFISFMIFGGVTFLIVGIRLILGTGPPVAALRPQSGELSGAIAMPFIVGPGTISASVLAGSRLSYPDAALAIGLALVIAIAAIILLKKIHDVVHARDERYVTRYMDIAGRVTALFTGSFAIELILKGVERWMAIQ
ncbi:MAG: MarC family protein [Candidatus Thiodiazotropha sp.]